MPLRKLQERLQYERTTGARLTLMWAGLLWAASLLAPETTMDRPPYYLMQQLLSEWGWVAVFSLYAVALTVPYRQTMARWLLTIGVHVVGVVLWGTVTSCLLSANGIASAAVMPSIALTLASAWVLRNAPRCPRPEDERHG